jgi:LysM domain
MGSGQQGTGTIVLLGAAAVGVVVALLGVLQWNPQEAAPVAPAPSPPAQTAAPGPDPAGSGAAPGDSAAAEPAPPPGPPAPPEAPPPPSFDVVRVEPNGDSVIAGRSVPGATVEMLRNGQVHARTPADQSGLFALVPPPLPPGSHEVVLQSIAPDGTRQRSKESVTIVVSENGTSRPLVALTDPDKPTVVLSSPEPADQKVAQAPAAPGASAEPPKASPAPADAAPPAGSAPPPRPEIKIVAVEAEDGGRLFVSGQAAPGATVRLYLNESFIAPGGVGGDGRVSFAIGRGVRPGDYRVRIDEVDPVSGSVKSRAEVAFNVPVPAAAPVAAAPSGSAPVPTPAPAPAPSTAAGGATPRVSPAGRAPANQVAAASVEDRDVPVGTVVIPDVNTAIVSRGDNLWRISHRIYGRGVRYTVIYGANQRQIRNPHRIYPGQVFVLPGDQSTRSN